MSRRFPLPGAVMAVAMLLMAGCHPQQPFYFFEDGDLSHYKGVATEIEYPDVQSCTLGEVEGALRPFSLENQSAKEIWDLRLEEAMAIALRNNKVIRSIGGQIQGPPDSILRNPDAAPTIYDPAIVETNPRGGVEGALSAFDAQFHSLAKWERFDEPLNTIPLTFIDPITGQPSLFRLQNRNDYDWTFQNRLQKTTATGGTIALSHDFINSSSITTPTRLYHMDWTVQLRAEVRQPLLQGAGVQFNRIAGPGAVPGFNNGVLLARINTDIALHDFEASVRGLVSDVEIAYWELYFSYRSLQAVITGRDSAARTWQEVNAKLEAGIAATHEEAQARQQYFLFKASMERALTALYQAESKLRYLMGLNTDGRLIRPIDEPTTAKVSFDWCEVHAEALARSVELRRQRWNVKRRELELIAAKNYLMPKLDAFAQVQWNGLGNLLLEPTGGTGDYTVAGSNAYQNLTNGAFQDWNFGLELTVPIGFRREMAGVRNAQLAVARERAQLQEAEFELSNQLAFALRDVESNLIVTQTTFNRRVAAKVEVDAAIARWREGVSSSQGATGAGAARRSGGTLADVIDAQRRLAEAEADYYRALIDYNRSIAQVHYRKGSLLEYNGVYLAEGPWPAKAYFDACRRARARDASIYLDYGFTRPKVMSRGPYVQQTGEGLLPGDEPLNAGPPLPGNPEAIPTPAPLQSEPQAEPNSPQAVAPADGTSAGVEERQGDLVRLPPTAPPQGVVAEALEGPDLSGETLRGRKAALATTNRPGGAKCTGSSCDIGSLDLAALAGKAKPRIAAPPEPARPSAVRRIRYEETDARSSDAVKSKGAQPAGIRWLPAEGVDQNHEPVATPTSAEADRPATGWKRLER